MFALIPNALPPGPVVMPMVAAALLAGARKHLPRAAVDTIAIFAALLTAVDCGLLLEQARRDTIVYWLGNWHPRGSMVLGIGLVIDPVGASIALLCSVLTVLALLYSWSHTDSGANHFQPLMLIFLAGMCGFSLTGDMFNMFVFFELMSTAAFALTGLKTGEPAPLQGAFNFAVTNTVAAFMVLIGIGMVYAVTGALNMAQAGVLLQHRHDALVLFACALITCGYFTKAAVVPFHFWLADAHAVSPTPVCVLFSGVMVELGLYAVHRLYAVIFVPAIDGRAGMLRGILLTLAIASAVAGGLMCFAQHHIKRLLAFSTVSHAGLMLIAMSLQGPVATAGFVFYLFGHAFAKSALFFLAGVMLERFRTASEPLLFGRGRGHWAIAALWFLGGLGLAGAPGFGTMAGESLADHAAEAVGLKWISYTFVLSGILTAGAVFRVGMHFLGWGTSPISDRSAQVDEEPDTSEKHRTPWYLITPPALCLAACIALLFVPHLQEAALAAGQRFWSQAAYLHATYTRTSLPLPPVHVDLDMKSAYLHGGMAAVLAILLALSSVYRKRLWRYVRAGAFLEGPLLALRTLQSGHVGDYVTWMTVGMATIGTAFVFLLR